MRGESWGTGKRGKERGKLGWVGVRNLGRCVSWCFGDRIISATPFRSDLSLLGWLQKRDLRISRLEDFEKVACFLVERFFKVGKL